MDIKNINLHILKADKGIKDISNEAVTILEKSVEEITKILPVEDVDIIFFSNPNWAIKEIGIGGYCPTKNTIQISVDTKFKNLKKSLIEELPKTLAHEFHHISRDRTVGYGTTLGEVLVTEGLADHFAIEVFGEKPNIWNTALSKKEISKFLEIAKSNFSNKNYDHYKWFFGSKEKEMPNWTGYTIAFEIIKIYLKENPGTKASQLVNIEANRILGTT